MMRVLLVLVLWLGLFVVFCFLFLVVGVVLLLQPHLRVGIAAELAAIRFDRGGIGRRHRLRFGAAHALIATLRVHRMRHGQHGEGGNGGDRVVLLLFFCLFVVVGLSLWL